MRRQLHLSTVFFLLLVQVSLAQTEKGRKFLGGSMNLGHSQNESTSFGSAGAGVSDIGRFSFGIYPYMGFFLRDGLALGTRLTFDTQHERGETYASGLGSSVRDSYRVGASLFLKKMNTIKGRLGWYIQPELGYLYEWDLLESVSSDSTDGVRKNNSRRYSSAWNLGASAGLYYFVGERWSLEADLLSLSLAYEESRRRSQTHNVSDQTKTSNRSDDVSLRLTSNLTNRFSLARTFTVNYYF